LASLNATEEINMLTWSDCFCTHIEIVDEQHKKLFELLEELSESFQQGGPNQALIEQALKELLDYANKHFVEEELLMLHSKLDARHVNLHRMEHKSFIYDITSMSEHLFTEEDLVETSERLVRFITSWLTFHILGIDQIMASQIFAIQRGASPEQAYENLVNKKYDYNTMHLIMDSVLDLWHMSLERCHKLETKLAALTGAEPPTP